MKLSYWFKLILLFILYFVTAKFGLGFDAVAKFATLVWLPSGISLAFLLLFGRSLWPAVTAGAFLVNFLTGAPLLVALGIALGNTCEVLVGVLLLKRYEFRNSMSTLKDVLLLILLAAPVGALVSASIGTSSLFLGGGITTDTLFSAWTAWWIGDFMSMLVITPLILLWQSITFRKISLNEGLHALAIAIWILLICILIFTGNNKLYPLTYLVFPPLIWASLRLGPREAVTAAFVISVFAIWGTVANLGPFTDGKLSNSLIMLQSFIGVTTVTTLIMSTIAAERRALEQRKDEFISIAGHELKTPLTTAQVLLQIIERSFQGTKDTKTKGYVKKAEIQLTKLTRLVNDLLDVSRMQAGKLVWSKEYFSPKTLITDIVTDIADITPTHIFIIKNKNIKQDIQVYADKERISQVVSNLLTNAAKYSPPKSKITIEVKFVDKTVSVGIRDHGGGIADEHQKKIFDRYYRVEELGVQALPGFGLGLYISHEIIKQNNGKMWVESKKGKGATFYFTLPRANRILSS